MINRKTSLIVAVAIVIGSTIVWFNLKQVRQDFWKENNITVQGEGKSTLIPNIFTFTISADEIWATTNEVNTVLAIKTNQATDILKRYGVLDKDIQSSNISINQNRVYDGTKSVEKWYRGSHTLTVTVREITNAGKIIDEISTVNGLLIQWGTYDNENEDIALAAARKEAFENAKKKAQELARLAGMTLGKTISINEGAINNYEPRMYDMMAKSSSEANTSTTINPGEREITLQLSVVFEIE